MLQAGNFEVDLLDLSTLASEYGRVIFPCKACVSTAMPLCHWPCSCYPNHALGQVNDWMNEIYPRWVAKRLELQGWSYPKHLAGRAFSIVVHGDAAGAGTLRRSLSDWLTDMHLIPGGAPAVLDRYVGYYEPYATSHDALDDDPALLEEVRNAARSLMATITSIRTKRRPPEYELRDPRPK